MLLFVCGGRLGGWIDQDACIIAVADDVDAIRGNRLQSWKRERLSGPQIELGSVQPAFKRTPVHFPLGEVDIGVRTAIANSEDTLITSDEGNVVTLDLDL